MIEKRGIRVTDEKVFWIWLSTIPGIGARRFIKLMEYFESPRQLFEASGKELAQSAKILGEKCSEQIASARNEESLKKAENILNIPDIRTITLMCPDYPPLLKNIYDPPPVLYCKGMPLLTDGSAVAVVGSRRSSEYGRMAAHRLSCRLAYAGVTIVSGMARGIDTMAHKGALDASNGYTIAVLGCGVDYIYPPENSSLYKSIMERGTIVSEYPPGTIPMAGNFPARNRIISGLAHGTLVVEAGLKSGALITVDFALEQGREVYALPGNINSPFSEGTNKLLKDGAKMITSERDILEDLDLSFRPAFSSSSEAIASADAAAGADASSGANAPAPKAAPQKAAVLDFFETLVYNALEDGEKGLEELIQITNLPVGRLNATLTLMEIKGIIKQIPGKIFMIQWKA
jgi:DNA processing protein